MTDCCNGCRFWREKSETRDPNDAAWSFGTCRRRPPVISEALIEAVRPLPSYREAVDPELDVVTMTSASVWPATHSADWCGEFALVGDLQS